MQTKEGSSSPTAARAVRGVRAEIVTFISETDHQATDSGGEQDRRRRGELVLLANHPTYPYHLPVAVHQIIQRPANALKELIENALDAGATTVRVTIKEGGTKLLQIQDNGSGIRKSDLPILCERFTTSKIKAYDDLSRLGTYGFRGEALASISHVAHLSVTTKTRDDVCAWKAAYSDGAMISVKGDGDTEPVPCAGNDGTLIVVEDLFFNTPTRLKSLRGASEEYKKIVDVLLCYSIHNAGISVVCKKTGSANADVNTTLGASVLDNIGLHYGESVRKELVELVCEDEGLGMKANGWFSGPNFNGKKGNFLFFINHRLVDCTPLKRAFEAFYSALLPKGSHPFVYLSLEISPSKIDVNVHPTKKEVGFEDEEEIVQVVCDALGEKLSKTSESRNFKVQTLLPSASRPIASGSGSKSLPPPETPTNSKTQQSTLNYSSTPSTSNNRNNSIRKVAPNKLVRTDQNAQTLDGMFPFLPSTTESKGKGKERQREEEGEDEDRGEENPTGSRSKRRKSGSGEGEVEVGDELVSPTSESRVSRKKISQSECRLKSVKELRKAVIENGHADLEAVVKNHIFVGVADLASSLSMLQYQTKLYLVNHSAISYVHPPPVIRSQLPADPGVSEELFYQLGLRQFGRLAKIKLKPAPRLRDLIKLAVERDEGRKKSALSTEEIVERLCSTLIRSRAMLDEYFSFSISKEGEIESLPLLLPGYTPDLNKLPLFLIRLGIEVNWSVEKSCFDTFLHELAYFYTPSRLPSTIEISTDEELLQKRTIQHVLFPAFKTYLVPSEKLLKRDFVQVTSLESLYKVFERC